MRRKRAFAILGVCSFVAVSGFACAKMGLESAITPVFLLLTGLVAWWAGFRASLAVAVCSTLGLDLFLIWPRFFSRLPSWRDLAFLWSFLGVSLLVSRLSHRASEIAKRLSASEVQQRRLFELSQALLLLEWKQASEQAICTLVQQHLGLAGVALWNGREQRFSCAGDAADSLEALQASARAGRDYDLPARGDWIRLLRFGLRTTGGLLLRGQMNPIFANAVASLIAAHLERIRALRAEIAADSAVLSEQLRTAVLDGLAHAVKTPLTSIMLSSSGLREVGPLTPLQNQLASGIEEEAAFLDRITNQLLRTASLQGEPPSLEVATVDLRELIQSISEDLGREYGTERIEVSFFQGAEIFRLDRALVSMSLTQILENALKYSPHATRVRVLVQNQDQELQIAVHNEGSYIPPEEQSLIFERYYRSSSTQHRAPGTGIGLCAARRAIEAHGGTIHVESSRTGGTEFTLALPRPVAMKEAAYV